MPRPGPGSAPRRIVGSLSDIHTGKQLEEQLRQAALYDALTGLPNRRLFLDRLSWAVDQARGRDATPYAVVFLDLDGFKQINDSRGHPAGDEVLVAVAARLQGVLRSVDTAARFGGDEFAVLLLGLRPDAVCGTVERLQQRIAQPIEVAGGPVVVTASVGITTSTTGYRDAEDVLRDADLAMYRAKTEHKGGVRVF